MGNSIPDITGPINTAMEGVVTQGLAAVGAIFPALFTIVGAVVVWRLGLSLFRRVSV